MNYELWEKVFTYSNNIKYPLSNNVYMPDKILKKRGYSSSVISSALL